MAIYAHPDDADVAAGGLLAQWAAEGCAVHLVVVCDGSKGAHAPKADAGSVRDVRGAELELAADLLGARERARVSTDPTATSTNDDELRSTLVGLIRRVPTRGRARSRSDGDVLRRRVRQPPRPSRDRMGAARRRRARGGDAAVLSRDGRTAPGRAAAAQRHPRTRRGRRRHRDHRHQGEGGPGAHLADWRATPTACAMSSTVVPSRPVGPRCSHSVRPFAVSNSPSEDPFGRRSADPARRPRRVLRVRRDPRRPDAARASRSRVGGAGDARRHRECELRGASLRCAKCHAAA